MTTSVKNNFMPPSLISNLQRVLATRNDGAEQQSHHHVADSTKLSSLSAPPPCASLSSCSDIEVGNKDGECVKPIVLVTNAEGIETPGLTFLVEALVLDARLDVCVCTPQLPALVISGINRGSSSGHNMFYSGAIAGARETLICGVPSMCISLNWKKDVSCESNIKDAVRVCLPLIHAAVNDLQKGVFPKSCLLNIEIPSCPLANKGFKMTRQSLWRSSLSWQAVSAIKPSSASHFMSNQQSLGIKLAQLSRDASAAGAARRLNSHRKNVEIESIGIAGKLSSQQTVKKYFRLEILEKERDNVDEDLDIRALEDGFVSITPLTISPTVQPEIQTSVSNWIADALTRDH
ncbi:hypothetical protein FNV43_RR17899 [Rhamnella rubrinervis]|uniref:Survival protein SurE-like phosphatase/nucleotidase domain-containing protein n=1 Tax=Rhamnella rubrinervis TaxID=2594499 RepID=A0A8K0E3H7_9ROSA|nr:hypothetical protein FNV43_RR17899 [Rhamnella rubrinervis]